MSYTLEFERSSFQRARTIPARNYILNSHGFEDELTRLKNNKGNIPDEHPPNIQYYHLLFQIVAKQVGKITLDHWISAIVPARIGMGQLILPTVPIYYSGCA